MRYLLA